VKRNTKRRGYVTRSSRRPDGPLHSHEFDSGPNCAHCKVTQLSGSHSHKYSSVTWHGPQSWRCGAGTPCNVPLTHPNRSKHFPTGPNTSKHVPTGPNTSQQVPTHRNTSQQVQTLPNRSKHIPTHRNTSQQVQTHPNTSKYVPTGPNT
jgi:hypothetical protein